MRAYVGGLGPLSAPMLAVLGPLGTYVGGPGPLLGMLAVLGRSWDLCWLSWGGLGTYVGGPGPLLGLYGRSWAALGAYVGGLGPLLGPMWAVWGRKMRRT